MGRAWSSSSLLTGRRLTEWDQHDTSCASRSSQPLVKTSTQLKFFQNRHFWKISLLRSTLSAQLMKKQTFYLLCHKGAMGWASSALPPPPLPSLAPIFTPPPPTPSGAFCSDCWVFHSTEKKKKKTKTINIINVINHANGKIALLGTVLEPDLAAMNDYDSVKVKVSKHGA